MCLLTFMPEGINISYEKAFEAAKSNPHGFGFAIHSGKTIIKDHDMSFGNLWARWEKLREIERGPAIFHFRITTHGLILSGRSRHIGDSGHATGRACSTSSSKTQRRTTCSLISLGLK